MTDNLVSSITRFLTPDMVSGIASACGIDASAAQKSVTAGVPAILSSLAGLASKPGGAQRLATAVAEQPSDILTNLSALTGSARAADTGTSMLSSILGGGPFGILTSTLAKFVGISDGTMRTMLGMLAPMIMGVLGREQRAAGLTSTGLANMLTEQKDQIAAAMPSGLGRALEMAGLPTSDAARGAARSAYEGARGYAAQAQSEMTASRPGFNWAYLVLPLLALGALLWFLRPESQPAEPTSTTTGQVSTNEKQVPEPADRVAYITAPAEGWTSIAGRPNEYVARGLHGANGERLGIVKDVMVGADGNPVAAVIEVGRFLGVGDKEVAVPMSVLRIERRDDGQRIIINATSESLQQAPAFKKQ